MLILQVKSSPTRKPFLAALNPDALELVSGVEPQTSHSPLVFNIISSGVVSLTGIGDSDEFEEDGKSSVVDSRRSGLNALKSDTNLNTNLPKNVIKMVIIIKEFSKFACINNRKGNI